MINHPLAFIPRLFPLSFEKVGNLCYNLSTCLAAGIPLPKAFRTTTQSLAKTDWGAWEEAADRLEHGATFVDALSSVESRLPSFVVPLIAAGEQTGRLDEVLRYLADHCRLLVRPYRAVRNAWLGPLAIYLLGIPLQLALILWFGSWHDFWHRMIDSIATVGSLATLALIVVAPPLKPAWDRIRTLIPFLGRAERDLSVSRFLRIFSLLYATGGMRVETMIRYAARVVSNDYFQRDVLRAAKRIERGDSLAQATSACSLFTQDELQAIAVGELSGTVESSCQRLANGLDESLEARMKIVTNVAVRFAMAAMTFSAVGLVMSLLARAVLGSMQ